jgi:hypothetical protein
MLVLDYKNIIINYSKKMKRLVIVLALFFSSGINIAHAAFSDVLSTNIYKTAIDYVQSEGIVNGYSDGTFRPDDSISRGEFTKIIINALYSQEEINSCLGNNFVANADEGVISYSIIFPDIEGGYQNNLTGEYSGGVFTKYICIAKIHGVISGYTDGTFKKDDDITVGQASKIISNAFRLTSNPLVIDQNHKFQPYIEALIAKKAIPSTIYLGVDDSITRGVVAEIIYRLDAGITTKPTIKYNYLIPDKSSIIFVGSELVATNNNTTYIYSVTGNHLLPYPECTLGSIGCEDRDYFMSTNTYKYQINADANVELYNCTENASNPQKQSIKYSQLHSLIINKQLVLCTQPGEVIRLFEITGEESSVITGLSQVWVK